MDLKQKAMDYLERLDDMTELEQLQEKNLLLHEILDSISLILQTYDLITK